MRTGLAISSGFAVFVLLLFAFWLAVRPRPAPPRAAKDHTTVRAPAPAIAAAPSARVAKPDRIIDPKRFAPLFGGDVALQREPPRTQLSGLASPRIPHQSDEGLTLLYGPVALAAGIIQTSEGDIRLQGIEVTEPDRTCTAADGATWPCGMVARTAFRDFLRGRAVRCDLRLKKAATDTPLTTTCTLAGADLGDWLVSHGWVNAAPDSPYADVEAAARKAGEGIFGPRPAY